MTQPPEALAVAVAHLERDGLRYHQAVERRAREARVLQHVQLVEDDLHIWGVPRLDARRGKPR